MESNLISENGPYIKDALYDGIKPEAVSDTLERLVRADTFPPQAKDTVRIIASMKGVPSKNMDERFLSDFIRANSASIVSALKDGLTPNEIASSLIKNLDGNDSLESKRELSFMIKLISKMKEKDLKLQRGTFQKILN